MLGAKVAGMHFSIYKFPLSVSVKENNCIAGRGFAFFK